MASKSRQMSIEEASEYWDHQSVAEHPSRVVEIEYAPEERSTLVAIENDLLDRISKSAKEQGVSVETLVNLWLQEKLTA
jgi:predicted DNA binding CopG/RHH family protein